MALVSPGVEVTIIDESFFVPAQAPTVPLIFIATEDEKTQPDGETPAAGTYEHDVVRTVTSLNQSTELYGTPSFRQDSSGNQLHGDARNEYGLLALNQFLGIGNLAYVVRANVNLNDDIDDIRDIWDRKMGEAALDLESAVVAFITEYNEVNNFVPSNPNFKVTVTKDEFLSLAREATDSVFESFSFLNSEDNFYDDNTTPVAATAGYQIADFDQNINRAQQYWDFGGSIESASQVINVGGTIVGGDSTGLANDATVYDLRVYVDGVLNTVNITGSAAQTYTDLVNEINTDISGATAELLNGNVRIISSSSGTSSSIGISEGIGADPLLAALTDFQGVNSMTQGANNPTGLNDDATNYTVQVAVDGGAAQALTVQGQNAQTFGDLAVQLNALLTGATIELTTDGNILVRSELSDAGVSNIATTTVSLLAALTGFNATVAATVGGTNPTGLANDATQYEASVTVDGIPYALQITGSAAQTFGALVTEMNTDLGAVATAVIGDGTTATNGIVVPNGQIGIVSSSTGITSTVSVTDVDLFSSLNDFEGLLTPVNGLPANMSLQVYGNGYDQPATGVYLGLEGIANDWETNSLGSVEPGEWTAEEAGATLLAAADDYKFTVEFLNETSLGANDAARRVAITTALQATINSNTEVRSENFEYNLIVAPGYPEVVDELIALSVDVANEAFVIADTPVNQDADETVTWAATTSRFTSPGVAYYYPWALQSNLDGVNVVGAPSGVALRTYAFSDDVSDLWFAPAGTRRGLVSGVSQLGHVQGTLGTATTFVETNLNQGQRDNLYKDFTNINPISFFPGRGFVVWGQKTSSPDLSARNRVNVERLVRYIKRQLRKSLISFVFEPNDTLTRDNVKALVDNFLGDLVVRRGLYDFATVCDETNNTPDRIDRNELYVDVAIKPVRAAEFIFVPIRIVATDAEI
jgi:hypothetical protein